MLGPVLHLAPVFPGAVAPHSKQDVEEDLDDDEDLSLSEDATAALTLEGIASEGADSVEVLIKVFFFLKQFILN